MYMYIYLFLVVNSKFIMLYMSPYLVLFILEFFPARLATLPYGLDSNVPNYTSQLVNQAICILLFVNCML